jgi:hypothetical protein
VEDTFLLEEDKSQSVAGKFPLVVDKSLLGDDNLLLGVGKTPLVAVGMFQNFRLNRLEVGIHPCQAVRNFPYHLVEESRPYPVAVHLAVVFDDLPLLQIVCCTVGQTVY